MKRTIEAVLSAGREECLTDIDLTMLDVFESIGRILTTQNGYPNEPYTYRQPVSGLSAGTLKEIRENYMKETIFDYIHGENHSRLVLEFMDFSRMNVEDFRRKYPKAYARWTEGDDRELLEGRRNGMSLSDLSQKLERNLNAIKIRLEKLGAGDEETADATRRF